MTRSPERITAPPISCGIDLRVQAHLALQAPLQRGRQLLLLRAVERRGRGHGDVDHSLRLILHAVEQRGDLRQVREAAVLGQRAHEVCAVLAQPRAGDVDEQLRELLRRHVRIAEQVRDARIAHHLRCDRERVGPGVQRLALPASSKAARA